MNMRTLGLGVIGLGLASCAGFFVHQEVSKRDSSNGSIDTKKLVEDGVKLSVDLCSKVCGVSSELLNTVDSYLPSSRMGKITVFVGPSCAAFLMYNGSSISAAISECFFSVKNQVDASLKLTSSLLGKAAKIGLYGVGAYACVTLVLKCFSGKREVRQVDINININSKPKSSFLWKSIKLGLCGIGVCSGIAYALNGKN